jgi:hypothetical protein
MLSFLLTSHCAQIVIFFIVAIICGFDFKSCKSR